jgi:hypothetical protein
MTTDGPTERSAVKYGKRPTDSPNPEDPLAKQAELSEMFEDATRWGYRRVRQSLTISRCSRLEEREHELLRGLHETEHCHM